MRSGVSSPVEAKTSCDSDTRGPYKGREENNANLPLLQTFNVLWATMGQYIKQGLVSDSRILDIKHVDISTGKMLENNVPVFLVTFASQEQLVFRSVKTGEVVVGSESDVEQCRYAMVLTRVEGELDNELTGGWKVVEVSLFVRPFLRGASVGRARIFFPNVSHDGTRPS